MSSSTIGRASCPTTIIDAPVEAVWALLVEPIGWEEEVFDVRIRSINPPGPARRGQKVYCKTGPRILHLKIAFEFIEIDATLHRLIMKAKLPFDVEVQEDMRCISLNAHQCRVNYNCNFIFPSGWRGVLTRVLMNYKIDAGPADSLSRLKRAAEQHSLLH